MTTTTTASHPQAASAAPPIAIIAEELGYFPVTNKDGETIYIPKKVQRSSSDQAKSLADHLAKSGATFYGAYWCPHCARQKELLGREAFRAIPYVECSPKGYQANPAVCIGQEVDGYPTWKIGRSVLWSGEATLSDLAKASGYRGRIDESLEQDVPPLIGSKQACQ